MMSAVRRAPSTRRVTCAHDWKGGHSQLDRNTILTIGVIVGAILVLVGLVMMTGKRFTQVSEGSFGGLFKIQGPVGAVVVALGVVLLVTCISNLGDESATVAGS